MPDIPSPNQKSGTDKLVDCIPVIIIGIVAFWFWGTISDFVVRAADDMLHLIVTGVAIGAILWVLFDKHFRNFVWYLYRASLRGLMGLFVKNDPLSIRKGYLDKMREAIGRFQSALDDASGQKNQVEMQLKRDYKDYQDACSKYDQCRKKNDDLNAKVWANEMQRKHQQIEQGNDDMKKAFYIVALLSRYRDICQTSIQDLQNDIKYWERNQERSRSFLKAMRASMAILKGLPEDQEMQDMAQSELEKQYASRMGEVEQILDITKGEVSSADLKDAAALEQADKLYQEWKGNAPQIAAPPQSIQLTTTQAVPASVDYKEFFK